MNKKLLSIAIAGAMALPTGVQAVKYKLSGQVNRAIVFMDDGEQSDVRHVDNTASGTRFRLRGSEDLGNGMKVGFYWELQTQSNPSSAARPDQDSDGNQNTNNLRQANVWFSGNWGKLTMGQGDGAGNGATEADLSGTAISGTYHGRTSFTGGIRWRTGMGGTLPGNLTAGNTYNGYDSFSRYDVLRYDTPALGPVTISANVGNDHAWEVAGRVNTALGGGQLSGAAFYASDSGEGNVDNRWGGSLSFLFSQGTNVTFAYAENETTAGVDSDVWSAKLGHKWGPHAVSVGYGIADDVVNGFEDTGWNIGYVHSLKKANTEIYASFMHQELDGPTGTPSVEDINIFVVGARVKFN